MRGIANFLRSLGTMETKTNPTQMNRRSFLQASAAAGAGLMLAPVGIT